VVFAIVIGAAVGGGLAAQAIYGHLTYGLALFLFVPFVTCFTATAALRAGGRTSLGPCVLTSIGSGAIVASGFLVAGKEGLVCIALALPLATPFLALGAWIAYLLVHRRTNPPTVSTAAVILLVIVTRRTWYSQRLYPAAYWRFWCEVGISHIHQTVLEQVRSLAPGGARLVAKLSGAAGRFTE
jgi:hypothetical protein